MKKTYNKFLIISTIALFVGGSYLYFSDRLITEGITPIAFGSSLTSSTGGQDSGSLKEDRVSSDIAFLKTLVALKNITIDTDFFNNKSFLALKNNSVTINPVKSGKLNPFGPMENISYDVATTNTLKVMTEMPSQVTKNSAILNGASSIASETALTYFEYSTSPQLLNPITVFTKQSLIGTFLKNILELNPQTNYFYRACVKINNIASCGEIITFTTTNQ